MIFSSKIHNKNIQCKREQKETVENNIKKNIYVRNPRDKEPSFTHTRHSTTTTTFTKGKQELIKGKRR